MFGAGCIVINIIEGMILRAAQRRYDSQWLDRAELDPPIRR